MAKAKPSDWLFIGVGGHAVALDPVTGTEIWRTKLKRSSFVTVSLFRGRIFAGAAGELFCLDPASGELLWHNRLKGLGLGVVAFQSSDVVSEAAAMAQRQAQAAATG